VAVDKGTSRVELIVWAQIIRARTIRCKDFGHSTTVTPRKEATWPDSTP